LRKEIGEVEKGRYEKTKIERKSRNEKY
jgi:hypothetical protein